MKTIVSIPELSPLNPVGSFGRIRGISQDLSGNLYIAEYSTNSILKITNDGTVLNTWTIFGPPVSVTADPNNLAIIVTTGGTNNQLLRIFFDNTVTQLHGSYKRARATAFDQKGNLFVSDQATFNVYKITPNNQTSIFASYFNQYVNYLAFDNQQNLLVSDADNGVKIFSPTGTLIKQILQPDVFKFAAGVSGDSHGNIYIAGTNSLNIVFYGTSTQSISELFSLANKTLTATPYCLFLDTLGNLWVGTDSGLFKSTPKPQTAPIVQVNNSKILTPSSGISILTLSIGLGFFVTFICMLLIAWSYSRKHVKPKPLLTQIKPNNSRITKKETIVPLQTYKTKPIQQTHQSPLPSYGDGTVYGNTTFSHSSNGDTKVYGGTTIMIEPESVLSIPAYLKIRPNSYIFQKSIAKGGFGEIFFIKLPPKSELLKMVNGRKIVAKRIVNSKNPEDNGPFIQELSIMSLFIGHPNFIQLVAYDDIQRVLITEFYPLGSLSSWMSKLPRIQMFMLLKIISGTFQALKDMHDRGLVHNDLKPANILVKSENDGSICAKLTDFGLSNIVDDSVLKVKAFMVSNTKGTTFCYCAPERMLAQFPQVSASTAKRSDIYSMGAVIFAIIIRNEPWNNENY